MNKETKIQNQIRVALSDVGCVVYRRNHGLFYTPDGRPITIGVEGEADLQGHTPEGKCFYIEVKVPGEKPRPEQEKFLSAMRCSGAIAGSAVCVEDALKMIREDI